MTEPHEHQRTADQVPSVPADGPDAGPAFAFGKASGPPRSTLGDTQRPVLLQEAEGESGHVVKPKSDAMPPMEVTGDRYQLSGEIARGGMGAVLRGRDVDLGRDLAVKVLLEKYANRPEVARRFIEEAQIGGQLQHPGVVPVYDIGRFGDRPFFTMKLVKGLTLQALLGKRESPAEDRPRLLGIALQVAQAVAYAHAKGVIHRDLKPANIMVGAFGEVQVMDWGLAKVLAEGGVADEDRAARRRQEEGTQIRTARSSGSAGSVGTETEMGSLLGTPAYMPPEQALGDIPNLDRRADVFGLGAILCQILTGRPPYVGRSGEEVRRKAANGDLADALARLGACGADEELIALTKGCLSPEAVDRPRDAQEVADGLSAYLNGVQERLQTAQRERAVALARAEEEVKTRQLAEEKAAEQRKRRRSQAQLAASLAVLLLGGVSVAWWQTQQAGARRETDLWRQLQDQQRAAADSARLARNAEALAALLGQCQQALRADDTARAGVVLEAAIKRFDEGGAEKEAGRLGQLAADLALLRDLDAVDQFCWTPVGNNLPDPAAAAPRTGEALRRFGANPEAVSVDGAAARVSASVVRERIVSALDRLLRHQKKAKVRALLRRLDADPYRNAVRDAVLANDGKKVAKLAGKEEALLQPSGFAAFLGGTPAVQVGRRQQLLQAAVNRRPGNLSLLMTLAETYRTNRKDWANERVRWYQAAAAAAPANPAVHLNLGIVLCDGKRDYDGAIACFRKAIELDPKFVMAHHNLGNALADKGKVDEAIACFKKAIELDPKDARAPYNLGHSLKAKGKVEEAIACFKKAAELDPKFAQAHGALGLALLEKGRYAEAKAASVRALVLLPQRHRLRAVISKVVKGCERFLKWQERLPRLLDGADKAGSAREWLEVVYVCQHKGMHAGAARFATQAFALDPKLADDLQAGRRYNAACHAALAAAGKGEDAARLDDAAKAKLRRQALDWLKADLAVLTRLRDSGPPQTRPFIVQTLTHWLQDTDLAGIRDKAALAKLPAQEQKAFTQLWADVAGLLKKATATLGAFLQQKLPEARKALGKDNPQLARLLAQIGMGLLEEKKWVEAEPLLRESLAIRAKARPDSWVTFNTRSMLGGALLGQEKYAEAEPLLLKGQAGMKEREKTIPRQDKERLSEAVQRLVQLYEATGKKDEAAKWRKELEKLEPPAGPGNKS